MTGNESYRVGLIGQDLDLSLSPVLHETEGGALGLDYTYDVFDGNHNPEYNDVAAVLERTLADGYRGVNITHPFKQTVIDLVDEMSDDAWVLGAINTVVFEGSKKIGHNTDWYGFAESIATNLSEVNRNTVVQFGAGGAGVAVAHALLRSGVEHLVLLDVDESRAARVAESLNTFHSRNAVEIGPIDVAGDRVPSADGVVNATPIGMPTHPGSAVPLDLLRRDLWVHDVVYMPLETELMAAARSVGALTVGGGSMLVHQAAEGFRLFTGVEPDRQRMISHLERIIAEGGQVPVRRN